MILLDFFLKKIFFYFFLFFLLFTIYIQAINNSKPCHELVQKSNFKVDLKNPVSSFSLVHKKNNAEQFLEIIPDPTIQQVVNCIWEEKLASCKTYTKVFESNRDYTFSEFFAICEKYFGREKDISNRLVQKSEYRIKFKGNQFSLLNASLPLNNNDMNLGFYLITRPKTETPLTTTTFSPFVLESRKEEKPELTLFSNIETLVIKKEEDIINNKNIIFTIANIINKEVNNQANVPISTNKDQKVFIKFNSDIYCNSIKSNSIEENFLIFDTAATEVIKYWIDQNQQILQIEKSDSSKQPLLKMACKNDLSDINNIKFIIYPNIDLKDSIQTINFIPLEVNQGLESKFSSLTIINNH
ncbi:hypothetical protein [Candidatus Phytoplasma pyri]|uniref:hypothetical protein n=1 Tax=Candidatus Phytoplasma pyri TaxID=47566 RepID=UPI0039831015